MIDKKPFKIRVFHWCVAGLFSVALATGYIAFDFGLEMKIRTRDVLFATHRLSGFTAGILVLVWGLFRARALIASLLSIHRWSIVGLYHFSFGVLCLLLPLFPWIARSLDGRLQELYSILPVHNLVSPPTTLLAYWMFQQHKNIVNYFLIMLALHMLAVLYHRLWRRDEVLATMLFGTKERW